MKTFSVLILAFCCCLCEVQVNENNNITTITISQNYGAVEEKLEQMADKIELLEGKLLNTEREVLELRSLTGGSLEHTANRGQPQVAFSAALRTSGTGNIGSFNTNTPLKYKRVFSNVGNCYNPSTGIFTAIVNGTYFFRFSMFDHIRLNSVVSLKKNSERLVSVWDVAGSDQSDMGSNAVVIHLEVGDNVYVELQANRVVYDNYMNYNTFTGFLLFT